MNIKEMEEKLINENLLSVCDRGVIKSYVNLLYENQETVLDSFGIIKRNDDQYEVSVIDSERGLSYFGSVYSTEEEACEKLYKYIKLCKQVESENNPSYKH